MAMSIKLAKLKILMYLREHDSDEIMNFIQMEDYDIFGKHLCISFENFS
jgi:hypothetical protein